MTRPDYVISAQPSEAQSQKLMEIRDSHDTHRLKWRPKSPNKFEFEDSMINPESPAPPPTITTFPSLKGQLKSNPWNKDHAPLVDKSVSGVKQRFESQNLFKKPLPDVVRDGQCLDFSFLKPCLILDMCHFAWASQLVKSIV